MPDPVAEQPPVSPGGNKESTWFDTILGDIGKVVGEPPRTEVVQPMTLAERSILVDEKVKAPEDPEKKEEPKPEEGKPETPAKPEEKIDPPAAGEPPKSEEPPTAPPATPEPPKVQVEKKKPTEELVRETVRKALEEAKSTPAEPPAPTTPEPPKQDPYESSLTEAQQEELMIARALAKKNPAKYGQHPEKLLGFYKKTDEYLVKAREGENAEERTFDERDADFQKFLRANKPSIDPVERRRIEREMIVEEAEARAQKKYEQELTEIKQRQKQLEIAPRIEAGVNEFASGLEGIIAQSETSGHLLKKILETGVQKAVEDDPVFAPIVANYQARATQLAAEYLSVFGGVKKYDPQNDDHIWLVDFVRNQGQHFARNGAEARVRGGKEFMPMNEYYEALKKDPTVADRAWTFETRDILTRLAANAVESMEKKIQEEESKLSKYGYKREKTAPTPPPEPPAKPAAAPAVPKVETPAPKTDDSPSPKAKVSSAPGPAKGAAPVVQKVMEDWQLRALGLPTS